MSRAVGLPYDSAWPGCSFPWLPWAGALFACFISLVWHSVLGAEMWFVVLAVTGVPPTFVALANSIDGRGHPLRWLSASATVYFVWYVIAFY